MKRLCFGSFATILKLCKIKSVTQKKLCGAILLSVAPNYDVSYDDGTTSDLILGKANLSPNVTDPAIDADKCAVAEYFRKSILPLLDNGKKSIVVLALRDIIVSDNDIYPDTIVERINDMTKKNIAERNAFVYADFLAGVFLYTATSVSNIHCEKYVAEITTEYLNTFEDQQLNVDFISAYSSFSKSTADEILLDAKSLALLTLTGGKCQRCGRPLAINKEGSDISYAQIIHLSENEDTVLCVGCAREMQNASINEKELLIADKRELTNLASARDATSLFTIERQVEVVLREINDLESSEATQLKTDPVKVEKKITEKRLKEHVLLDVRLLYEGVNDALDRLSGENRLNVDAFAKSVKRMYEDASENLDSQSAVYNLLVDMLFDKTGHKYKEACAVIISYFVQRCEVFEVHDETTK